MRTEQEMYDFIIRTAKEDTALNSTYIPPAVRVLTEPNRSGAFPPCMTTTATSIGTQHIKARGW